MSDLTIIIVSWNVRDLLERCLNSVDAEIARMEDSVTVETIVVDNDSADGTAEMVKRRSPWVRLIEAGANLGFARANNLAQQESWSKYYLYLNPDTEISNGSIAGMMRFLEENDTVAAVGPALLNTDGTLQHSTYPAPTLGREFWRLMHLDWIRNCSQYPLEQWRHNGPRKADVIQGACLMIRAEALHGVGLLDEGYFMYTEEVDLCLRLRRAGWDLYWLPSLSVLHHGGQSTKLASRKMFLHLYRSKLRYFRKQFGPRAARTYKLILAFASLLRLVPSPIAYLESEPGRSNHLKLAANYFTLLHQLPRM